MSTNGDYATTIGPDAVFKGEVEFESGARVLGRIEGTVSSKGSVLIAEGSECKAAVTAKDIAVEGMLTGNVEAGDRIAVSGTGQVHGDIQAARMTMAEGATVNGFCRIGVAANGNGSSNGAAKTNGTAKTDASAEAKPAAAKAAAKR